MGVVPALVLAIAAGISYGWQPDRDGGVEYIIQVPPDQLERLQEIGEISSVIDPQVRGRVSRVIIRVGTGPLPKETPPTMGDRSVSMGGNVPLAYADASDAAPLPIPEMGTSGLAEPILGMTAAQSVLKPDANSPAGTTGYGYPGLPPTLQTGSPQIDQAGREIPSASPSTTSGQSSILGPAMSVPNSATSNAAATSGGTIRVPPPATRSPSSSPAATPPPFTGTDPNGDYARARAGGPSTEPTNPRDNTWRDFPSLPSTTSSVAGGQTSSGSTAENPFRNQPGTTGNATSGGSGLAPTDTYGKLPGGLRLVASNAAGASPSSTATGYGNPPSASGTASGQVGTYANGTASSSLSNRGASGPDPRLTHVQVAAGAWSIDTNGQILDRQGRAMSAGSLSPSTTVPSPRSTFGNGSFPAATPSTPNPTTGQPNGFPNTQNPRFSIFGSNAGSQADSGGTGGGADRATTSPSYSSGAGNQPIQRTYPSAPSTGTSGMVHATTGGQVSHGTATSVRPTSSRSIGSPPIGAPPIGGPGESEAITDRGSHSEPATVTPRKVVAPQPLFNGLLLISLVANVYLIFWLKNLRLQFRDLVAAKRMASSQS